MNYKYFKPNSIFFILKHQTGRALEGQSPLLMLQLFGSSPLRIMETNELDYGVPTIAYTYKTVSIKSKALDATENYIEPNNIGFCPIVFIN